MKIIAKIFCIGLLISFYGCLPGIGEWDITLYEQKIEGTSKAIYKYDAWGGRDSHVSGYTVRDTTQKFTIAGVNNLPISQLTDIPNKNLIQAIATVRVPYEEMKDLEELFVPVETKKIEIEGLNLRIKYYQDKDLRNMKRRYYRYQFNGFKETRDSITFYDLNDIVSMDKSPHRDSIKVKKGHVIIRQRENLGIVAIEIEDLTLSNGQDSLISNLSCVLTSKNKIELSEFSDYGMFKEKSTAPNNGYSK
ncbi:hypothetical protein JQC67_18970 [Aurantibacter crassamenti]|uniref:hypothetical protein n=1 Tax=Aurantibacter crassamenti TaxID=1837375 RepID=UPI00193A3A60|nr:hypothetical protein [Aurantibacter crassamenti]MBM1108243.1 hypothetical protein [Aurantibacter crassamenti]